MDKSNKKNRKSVKLTEEQHAAYRYWVKDVEGDTVAGITGIRRNTIYRVSICGQGKPSTIKTILEKMPAKYFEVTKILTAEAA